MMKTKIFLILCLVFVATSIIACNNNAAGDTMRPATIKAMECSQYARSGIVDGMNAQEFCEKKGYNTLCLINRHSRDAKVEGGSCAGDPLFSREETMIMMCANNLVQGDSECRPNGEYSMLTETWDEVVCCR